MPEANSRRPIPSKPSNLPSRGDARMPIRFRDKGDKPNSRVGAGIARDL
jgi:hypothetical protein